MSRTSRATPFAAQTARRPDSIAGRTLVLAAALAAAAVARPALAANTVSTYTGGATAAAPATGNFNAAGNWSPAGVPVSGAATQLDFGNSGANAYTATHDLGAGFVLNEIVFASTSTGATTVSPTGGSTFNFAANAGVNPSILQNGTGPAALSVPIVLSNPLTFGGSANGTLTYSGDISGAGGVVKQGPGTLILNGAASNSYSGTTTVNGGTLSLAMTGGATAVPGDLVLTPTTAMQNVVVRLGASNQLAATSNVTLNTAPGIAHGTTQLDLNGFNNTVASLTFGPQTSGQVVTVSTGAGTLTLNGNVNIGGANTNPLTVSGKVDLGGATRTIAQAVGSTNTGSVLTVSAVLSNGGVTQTYPGTVVLSGANTYTGPTRVSNGTLSVNTLGNAGEVSSSVGAAVGADRNIVLGGTGGTNGILAYTGATTSTDHNFVLDAPAGGGSAINVTGAGTLTITGGLSGPHSVTLGGTGTGVYAGVVSITAGTLNKSGTGTWTLSNAANTFTTPIAINQGTLSIPAVNNSGTNGVLGNSSNAIALGSVTAAGTLRYTGSAGSTNRPISLPNAVNGGVVDVTTAGTVLTFAGATNGVGSLTKTGPGTLSLSNNNYTGNTTVTAGMLGIALPNLGDGSTVSIASGASLDLAFAGSGVNDSIGALLLNGVAQPAGVYNAGNAGPFLTGPGNLVVVPEPTSFAAVAFVAAGFLARRRRRTH